MSRYRWPAVGLFAGALLLVACSGDGRQIEQALESEAAQTAAFSTPPAFDSLMARARSEDWHTRPLGNVTQDVALYFEGQPYVAGLLDRGTEETLVTSFDGFDCVLLVETAVAAARSIRLEDYTYDGFLHQLESLRYRSGKMDGYCSRLHYFSEWIHDNEERGNLRNLTEELGGVRLNKRLNFMSSHRDAYPRIVMNDSLFAGIEAMESKLEGIEIFYIPQERIRDAYGQLQAGDIIATATSIEGLDVSHTGLVYRDGEDVGFLHASTSGGVMVSPDLQRYVENIDIQIGIVVARPMQVVRR